MPRSSKPIRQPTRKRNKPPRRRRGNPLLAFVSLLIIVIIVAMAFSLFFRVDNIEVTGNVVCDAQEVRTSAAIEERDFLFFINKVAAIRSIKASQPYADEVKIVQKLPNTVEIQITETFPVVSIAHLDNIWLMDSNGKLLSHGKSDQGLPRVVGVTLLVPVEGTTAAFPAEQDYKLQALLDILTAAMENDLLSDIQSFDLGDTVDVKFSYLDRFTVNLGVTNDLQRKLEFLPHMIAELEPNARGIIDLSEVSTRKARFIAT